MDRASLADQRRQWIQLDRLFDVRLRVLGPPGVSVDARKLVMREGVRGDGSGRGGVAGGESATRPTSNLISARSPASYLVPTSSSNRGFPRSGSHAGSSRRVHADRSDGTDSKYSSRSIASSARPVMA